MSLRKGDIRKQEILKTAEMMFCRNGYEKTSIQDIIDVLHSSKGSFYHHFECGAFIHQAPVIADIKADFEETLKDCTLMTPENYKKLPWRYRFLGRLFRVIAPLI